MCGVNLDGDVRVYRREEGYTCECGGEISCMTDGRRKLFHLSLFERLDKVA